MNEGLLQGVVHSVNRHILFLRNRKPLSFSSKFILPLFLSGPITKEGLLQGVVHSANRHILFLRNRKPLSFSSENRHRHTGRTIILITDLLTARSKFFAICQLNNRISPHKDQIVSITPFSNQRTKRFSRLMGCSQTQRLLEMFITN